MNLTVTRLLFLVLGCSFFAAILTTTAHAETHTYRIYNYPQVDRGISCENRAAEYSARLAEVMGVRVLGALCEYSDIVERHSIIIRYEAEAPLQSVSTYTFAATYADKGVYRTLEECLDALPREEALFESHTDLSVFLSFCGRERLESDRPYYPQVDGFGNPRLWPARADWSTDRPYGNALDQLRADVTTRFAERGAELIHLTVRPRASFGRATAFFYGAAEDQRLSMSGTEVVTISGLAACEEQLQALRAQLEETAPTVTGYCSSPYSNPTRFELTVVHFGFRTFDFVESSQTFSSLGECQTAEAAIVENMEGVYGEGFLGAVCGMQRFSGGGRNEPYRVIGLRTY